MRKKLLPAAIAVVVSLMFLVPGFAFGARGGGGKGKGTPSPPPSNPPCDANGHNGQPPPYGGPLLNTLKCKLDRVTTGNATGNATTGGTTGNGTTTGGTTTTTTTGGAVNQCTWDVTIAGTEVLPDTFIEGLIGVHADVVPDAVEHPDAPIGLLHACLGIGSIVVPEGGGQCPTGTTPIEAQTDQSSFLLLCVLL